MLAAQPSCPELTLSSYHAHVIPFSVCPMAYGHTSVFFIHADTGLDWIYTEWALKLPYKFCYNAVENFQDVLSTILRIIKIIITFYFFSKAQEFPHPVRMRVAPMQHQQKKKKMQIVLRKKLQPVKKKILTVNQKKKKTQKKIPGKTQNRTKKNPPVMKRPIVKVKPKVFMVIEYAQYFITNTRPDLLTTLI